MTKEQLMQQLIEKQDEYIARLLVPVSMKTHEWLDGCVELSGEIAFLKSRLAEAGEEKIVKKCRQCKFFDLDVHIEPCESCYPIAYSNWQPR